MIKQTLISFSILFCLSQKIEINKTILVSNVILHLKCKLSDINNINNIKYEPNINEITNFNINDSKNLPYNYINNKTDDTTINKSYENCSQNNIGFLETTKTIYSNITILENN